MYKESFLFPWNIFRTDVACNNDNNYELMLIKIKACLSFDMVMMKGCKC